MLNLNLDRFAQFFDVNGAAAHVLHLLQTEGATALDAVRSGMAALKAFTGKDYVGIFTSLNKANADVQEIIAAVKAEFGSN